MDQAVVLSFVRDKDMHSTLKKTFALSQALPNYEDATRYGPLWVVEDRIIIQGSNCAGMRTLSEI